MALTGDREGPPLAIPWPDGARLAGLAHRFALDTALFGERAAASSLRRRGKFSCGGRTHLMRASDGWVALSLARSDDLDMMPALIGVEVPELDGAWTKLEPVINRRQAIEIDQRAELLGICFSVVGAGLGPMTALGEPRAGSRYPSSPLVVDLSALWAGPLCAHLLQLTGARVIKVEDASRPDGARGGPRPFFDILNQHKLSVVLDFGSPHGRAQLIDLISAANVVVTSSRARAFDQLGIVVDDVLSASSDKVWTAITAYGWSSNRVGYGDDVAAGAGLLAWHPLDGEPRFAGDAMADPLCGLEAAALTLDCLSRGGRWFVDASLAGAAAKAAPPKTAAQTASMHNGRWFFEGQPVEEPRVRPPTAHARAIGADTGDVLAELGYRPSVVRRPRP